MEKSRVLQFGILAVLLNGILVFVVLPQLNSKMDGAYGRWQFSDGYDLLAQNIVSGHGYRFYPDTAPTLMREPGYPMLLAGIMLIFGGSFAAVKMANMVLAVATAFLVLGIAARLASDRAQPNKVLIFGAPLLFLFHPGVLVAEIRGGVEIVFAFLVALLLLTIIKAIVSNRWDHYLISGVVLGLCVLVKSTPLLFPGWLLVYLLIAQWRRLSFLAIGRNIALMTAAMFVVLSPWIARNYRVSGRFVATASVLGVSAQAGQYIGKHQWEGRPYWILDREAGRERDREALALGYKFEDGAEGYYQTFYHTGDEIRFSHFLTSKVVAEYRNSPQLFARCLIQNVFNFWFAGKTWTATALNILVQLPYLLLAAIGAICAVRNGVSAVGPIVLFIAYVMAVHIPILAQARYSIALMSLIAVLAAVGLAKLQEGFVTLRHAKSPHGGTAVSCVPTPNFQP